MSVVPPGGRGRAALPALLAAVVLVLAACGAPAAQGGYPTRNVQLIVPYPAGSAIDATARALVEIVNGEGRLGRRVPVVNREGGAGAVGTTATLGAKPDGHTIGLVPDGPLTLLPRTEKVSYDPVAISVIREVTTSPVLFVVPGESPYKSVADLVAAAKAKPGAVTIAEGPLNYAIPAGKFEQLTLEVSLRQTLAFSDGNPGYVLGRPVTMVILGLVVLAVALSVRRAFRARRAVSPRPGRVPDEERAS